MPTKLTLPQPDDWHIHLRDGPALSRTVADACGSFRRVLVMPNLKPPVCTVAAALAYRQRILQRVPAGQQLDPLMALYLTESTTVEEVMRVADCPHTVAFKWYPAGATTHSEAGVHDIGTLDRVLQAMAEAGVLLLVHGEVTDPGVDVFDREAVFIERTLKPLCDRYPDLRLVLEHISTASAARFVRQAGSNIAATLTPQHLLNNRNALLAGGIRPHYYCLPLLKTEADRQALLQLIADGHPRCFLGTDSAPHARPDKETACGCAGIYSAPWALPLYAEAFAEAGALNQLAAFAGERGAAFYQLPASTQRRTLIPASGHIPDNLPYLDGEQLVPYRAGSQLSWQWQ